MDKTKFIPLARNGAKLVRGSRVEIFRDPLTEIHLEGLATLESFYSIDDPDSELWNVRFPDSNQTYIRKIKIYSPQELAADQPAGKIKIVGS